MDLYSEMGPLQTEALFSGSALLTLMGGMFLHKATEEKYEQSDSQASAVFGEFCLATTATVGLGLSSGFIAGSLYENLF